MDKIFNEITSAFGALWKCRPRGNSIEIITPFPTSTEMFVSVFVTQRGDAWIATDGGYMDSGTYNCEIPSDEKIYSRILTFFENDFEVKSTIGANGITYFYKGTRKRELIPNIVFDLANFISMTVSTAIIEYRDHNETERFNRRVKDFLKSEFDEDKVKFNSPLNENLPARFGAVISGRKGKFSLINLVSGSSRNNIRTGFAKSNMNYDLLDYSAISDMVSNRLVLIDDTVTPMDSPHIVPLLQVCRQKNQIPLSWSNSRDELLSRIVG